MDLSEGCFLDAFVGDEAGEETGAFGLCEEFLLGREVWDKYEDEDAEDDCDEAFEDEDPGDR